MTVGTMKGCVTFSVEREREERSFCGSKGEDCFCVSHHSTDGSSVLVCARVRVCEFELGYMSLCVCVCECFCVSVGRISSESKDFL